jgi:hypothetical protein
VGVLGRGRAAARGWPDLKQLMAQFGGRYTEIGGADSAWELARFAARVGAGVLVIGDPVRSRGRRLARGSVARRVLGLAGPVEVCVVPSRASDPGTVPAGERPVRARAGAALPSRRRVLAWLLAAAGPAALVPGLGVAHLIDGPVVIVLAVVAAAIVALVHALAHRARRAARARAEADRLARLVACALADAPRAMSRPAQAWPARRPLQVFADELRRSRPPGNGPEAKPYAPGYTPQDSR